MVTMRRVGAAPLLAVILLIAGQQHARAAEPKMVTLSCDGTLTHRTITENKPVSPSPPEQMQKGGDRTIQH